MTTNKIKHESVQKAAADFLSKESNVTANVSLLAHLQKLSASLKNSDKFEMLCVKSFEIFSKVGHLMNKSSNYGCHYIKISVCVYHCIKIHNDDITAICIEKNAISQI